MFEWIAKAQRRVLCLVFLLLMSGVSGAVQAEPLQVTATFSVIADMAREVGGERVIVSSIVPLGGDPHTWEATPREARSVAAADVLFYNGLGLEVWVDRLIDNAARPDLPIVVLSEGLTPMKQADFAAHPHEEGDPHFWLNVQYGMHYVERIRDALIELDPEYAEYYEQNAKRYLAELAELDEWIEERIAAIPKEHRKLITYHDAFGYLAERYGLEIAGFLVVNPDREPSSREMANLVQQLADFPRRVVFVEPQIGAGHRYGEAVANEIDGRVGLLYSDSLTEEVPTYIDMMRFNANQLWEELR